VNQKQHQRLDAQFENRRETRFNLVVTAPKINQLTKAGANLSNCLAAKAQIMRGASGPLGSL
jgi:hypothetical protein